LITKCACGEQTSCEHAFRDAAAVAIAAQILAGHSGMMGTDQDAVIGFERKLQLIAKNSMAAAVELARARDQVDDPEGA
jgi:hypothetical protein